MDQFDIEQYDFPLDESLIAQEPSKIRDHSRMMVLNKTLKTIEHKHFYDILDYLKPGDVLVRNNSKVIPARLFGIKEETNAHVEILLLKDLGNHLFECLVGNAKVVKVGTKINFQSDLLSMTCKEVRDEGIRIMELSYQGILYEILEKLGRMPLPPYIHSQLEDNDRYQTVYAKVLGSAAAPTAGFHFTEEIFAKAREKGVEIIDITLHIGLGTFRPVKVKNILEHHMHSEEYEISSLAAERLNLAKKENRRIIAIGTTSTRTLEANYSKYGCFKATKEATDIFIYPGYQYKAINCLITNFHLPKSTLIMLVSAFAGKDFIMEAYNIAVKERYHFFSFGDCMFIYG